MALLVNQAVYKRVLFCQIIVNINKAWHYTAIFTPKSKINLIQDFDVMAGVWDTSTKGMYTHELIPKVSLQLI